MKPTRSKSPSPSPAGRQTLGATVRIGPLIHIPPVLRELGFVPEAVLAEAGFDPAYFDDPDLPIPYVAASKLLAHCVAFTRCEHFGLLVGARGDPSILGLVGFLLMSAPDVGTALRDLLNYLDLHDRGGVASLETRGGTSLLGFAVVEPDAQAIDQIHDLSMAVGHNIMRTVCGPKWTPAEVLLPRRRPADPAPWTRVFRAPIRFEAGRSALAFPSRWLAHPTPAANPPLHRHLEREAAGVRSSWRPGFAGEIRRTVSGTIASGKGTSADIAQLLGIHQRTLNRRLLADGTTFKEIRDEVRYAISRQLLGNTSMNLTEIAEALGYAEASAFLRAFARWSGQTPQRWRDAHAVARRHEPPP